MPSSVQSDSSEHCTLLDGTQVLRELEEPLHEDSRAYDIVPSHTQHPRGKRLLVAAVLVSAVVLAIILTLSRHTLHGITAKLAVSASKAAEAGALQDTILKSPRDTRQYRVITLPNGLRALLISDANTTTSAAALSVHVGYDSDPDEIPGVAHFCEHMLFLGNREYPEEDSFSTFLSAHGGFNNAYTEATNTVYYFEVSPGSLKEALKRFSAFFKGPLFTESATEKEVNAINAEDGKNQQDDGFRLSQLIKSFAAKGHPQRHFGTGNRQTLLVEPMKHGIRIQDELLKLFKLYDAGLMFVSVLGRDSLDRLQVWVEKSFGPINGSSDALNPYRLWQGVNPYPPTPHVTWLEAVPVNEQRTISISWPFVFADQVSRSDWIRAKPFSYIVHLLGYEGQGSLQSLLKKRGLVQQISAGISPVVENFAQLEVTIAVSEKGLKERDEIVSAMYAVIQKLREGIPDYVIAECQALAKMDWLFAEKTSAGKTVKYFIRQMQTGYEPQEYISGPAMLHQPIQGNLSSAIQDMLKGMTPKKARYMSVAKAHAKQATHHERWYGTSYREVPVLPEVLQTWVTPDALSSYQFPRANTFVPRNFDLKHKMVPDAKRQAASEEPPTLVRNDERWQIFYKPDRAFGVPRAVVRVFLWLPKNDMHGDEVASLVWQSTLADRLDEILYDAGLAGLKATISVGICGFELVFAGYNDKLVSFVRYVLSRIHDFDGPSSMEFGRAVDAVSLGLKSHDNKKPYKLAGYFFRLATERPQAPIEMLRLQMPKLTLEQVKRFGMRLHSGEQRLHGQALVHGNLDIQDFRQIMEAFDRMPFVGLPTKELARVQLVQLPLGSDTVLVHPDPNHKNTNSALMSVYSISQDPKVVVRALLLQSLLRQPFYTQLRTKQQLGYIVGTVFSRSGLMSKIGFVIQSSTWSPDVLLDAVDKFLRSFRGVLAALPDASLEQFRTSLEEQMLRADESLEEENNRWWSEILTFQYDWDRRRQEAAFFRNISSRDLLTLFDDHIAAGGALRRRVVSAIFAAGPQSEKNMTRMEARSRAAGATIVHDPVAFSAKLPRRPFMDRDPGTPCPLMDRDMGIVDPNPGVASPNVTNGVLV